MPTIAQSLDEGFKKAFGIDEIHDFFRGGQKLVFIISRHGKRQALKLFVDFGKRDLRELNIYEQFKSLDGIPKIISVEDYQNDKVVFEEFIEGNSLHNITTDYAGDESKISELLRKICTIMQPIWADKKVHRDLKPNNIMIRPDGNPVIIDFGIALDMDGTTYTDTGFQPNSWDFCSPEQFLGQKDLVDYRSDFFSLGLIGFYLHHQRLPFANTQPELNQIYRSKQLVYSPETDCRLIPFFQEVLKFNPSERPRSAEKLLELLSL